MPTPTAVTPVALNGHVGVNRPTPANGDNVNGNTCANFPSTIFNLKNSAGVSGTFTVTPAVTFKGESLAPLVVTLAASADELYQFDPDVWGHEIVLTPSASTMQLAVIQP
jgi:hypothetical protein